MQTTQHIVNEYNYYIDVISQHDGDNDQSEPNEIFAYLDMNASNFDDDYIDANQINFTIELLAYAEHLRAYKKKHRRNCGKDILEDILESVPGCCKRWNYYRSDDDTAIGSLI
jgi:hypothetical protein